VLVNQLHAVRAQMVQNAGHVVYAKRQVLDDSFLGEGVFGRWANQLDLGFAQKRKD
jgi:hypothetical protein